MSKRWERKEDCGVRSERRRCFGHAARIGRTYCSTAFGLLNAKERSSTIMTSCSNNRAISISCSSKLAEFMTIISGCKFRQCWITSINIKFALWLHLASGMFRLSTYK